MAVRAAPQDRDGGLQVSGSTRSGATVAVARVGFQEDQATGGPSSSPHAEVTRRGGWGAGDPALE